MHQHYTTHHTIHLALPTCPAMEPRGVPAARAYASTTHDPACWNTMGTPPGPNDSRLTNTPTRGRHLLNCDQAFADCGGRGGWCSRAGAVQQGQLGGSGG
jgi:hypothetical protein